MPIKCESCAEPSTGFYVLYQWDEDLQTYITVTGAYLCDSCRDKWGYEE